MLPEALRKHGRKHRLDRNTPQGRLYLRCTTSPHFIMEHGSATGSYAKGGR